MSALAARFATSVVLLALVVASVPAGGAVDASHSRGFATPASTRVPLPSCSHPRGAAGAFLAPLGPVGGGTAAGPAAADSGAVDSGGADSGTTDAGAAGSGAPDSGAPGTTRTAVVDRFEGDRAVLLVEAGGRVVARRSVRRAALPRAARHDDAVVTVSVVNDSVAAITYRPVETARRRRAAERRFEGLSEPAPGGDGPALC